MPPEDAWLETRAGEAVAYLTTTGRRTKRPHRIEIWFATEGGRLYLMAGDRHRSDWVRNLRSDPRVSIELAGESRAGLARILTPGTDEDRLARDLLVAKYRQGDNLDEWGRTSLPVVIEFSADDVSLDVQRRGPEVAHRDSAARQPKESPEEGTA